LVCSRQPSPASNATASKQRRGTGIAPLLSRALAGTRNHVARTRILRA
jgi:hypothetical protein